MKRNGTQATRPSSAIRCAIYTRKSTEEGLEQEFNSLDAQRESGEAYIRSQQHEGWVCLPDRYDDGGFTGGNMERPALQRLLADIAAGRIDVVVVYKVDRLSRSLLDFARIMESFDQQHVSFCSVTQQFNTTHSMGRLTLNILLSFAQFEREIIAERTRDKIAAARRKGKWSGGMPLLGYDVDPKGSRLTINAEEALQVRTIFALYLEHEALLPVVQELERRGWHNKQWRTRRGRERGGKPFTKTSLHRLLTNPTYAGRVRYKTDTHSGEHQSIVEEKTWQRVQAVLQRNGRTGGGIVRNQFGALLKGILRCGPCGCAMTPAHTTRTGNRRYRYYTCTSAQKRGWQSCPSKSIPAQEIERFVVLQIRRIGRDPALLHATLAQTRAQLDARVDEREAERRTLARELQRWHNDVQELIHRIEPAGAGSGIVSARLADLQERIQRAEQRLTALREEILVLNRQGVSEEEVLQALETFDPVWEALTPQEQTRIVQLLVERVDYDGQAGKVAITFHPSGIKALATEASQPRERTA